LLRPEEELTLTEQHLRAHVLEANAAIRTTQQLMTRCRDRLRTRAHEQFTTWQQAAQASETPAVRGFVASLLRDEDAVKAAVTEDWSRGQVEGQVSKVKLVKRLLFGRATCDSLRRRVLVAS
jgi:transposase